MPESAINYGKELLSWEVSDHHGHERGTFWYVAAAVIALGTLIYAVLTRNFLFAFIIIMFGIIIVTHTLRPTGQYRFSITERGIVLGKRFYQWKDMVQFWIVYEPPAVKTLYFDFGGLRPRLPVSLENTDPNMVRKTLLKMLQKTLRKLKSQCRTGSRGC